MPGLPRREPSAYVFAVTIGQGRFSTFHHKWTKLTGTGIEVSRESSVTYMMLLTLQVKTGMTSDHAHLSEQVRLLDFLDGEPSSAGPRNAEHLVRTYGIPLRTSGENLTSFCRISFAFRPTFSSHVNCSEAGRGPSLGNPSYHGLSPFHS